MVSDTAKGGNCGQGDVEGTAKGERQSMEAGPEELERVMRRCIGENFDKNEGYNFMRCCSGKRGVPEEH